MDPTEKFRRALPYAFLPASPALAALHSIRAPEPDWCSKCGSYLVSGNAEIQVVRIKQRMPPTRVLRKTCHTCRFPNDTLIVAKHSLSIASRPKDPRPVETSTDATSVPLLIPSTQRSSTSALSLPATVQPKTRPKKKSGLQEMLSRNREKNKNSQSNNVDGQLAGGLAAFLNNL